MITSGLVLELRAPSGSVMLLDQLIDYGWSAGTGGQISYLPLGDGERFAWRAVAASEWVSVRRELVQKEREGEGLGLALCWQAGDIGGTFHVEPPDVQGRSTLWTVWYPSRIRLLDAGGLTNHSWYVRRVVPPLLAGGAIVVSLTCNDLE